MTKKELQKLGWEKPDIILITGDAYIDSPTSGASVIGHYLVDKGFKVALISQPDIDNDKDITAFGEPELFWAVTSGCVDSMVSNYTASKKKRHQCDLTPGGENTKRPDRAIIAYANLIRKNFKETKPIVIGGIEASLRRIVHYDYWSNALRRSLLFDSKADYLVYGMGELAMYTLAEKFKSGNEIENTDGICYISKEKPETGIELPSFEECKESKEKFEEAFMKFYVEASTQSKEVLFQKHSDRYLVQNRPSRLLTTEELDKVYELPYEYELHPYCGEKGEVRAMDTIRYSVTTHRGCYGECSFCAIAVHQGRTVVSRSEESIVREIENFIKKKKFKGNISDIGGATANMYGYECSKKEKQGPCRDRKCLFPEICPSLKPDHSRQIKLLEKIRKFPYMKHLFVASGIRYDLILEDKKHGKEYLKNILQHHISGQMKIAPEHSEENVLRIMGKPSAKKLVEFRELFNETVKKQNKKMFLTYYFIAAHPGCHLSDMEKLKKFTRDELKMNPEQIQIFTPTPSTISTLIFYTRRDPITKNPIFVEKELGSMEKQKRVVVNQKLNKKRI